MIPEFVRELGYSQDDWVEERDAVFSNPGVQLVNHNAKVWFTNNCLIRVTIALLDQEISEALANNAKPPNANFRLLVRRTGITNITLRHRLRGYWVEAELERLQNLTTKKVVKEFDRVKKLESIIESFELSDKNLRLENLKITVEKKELLIEIETLKKMKTLLLSKLSDGGKGLIT